MPWQRKRRKESAVRLLYFCWGFDQRCVEVDAPSVDIHLLPPKSRSPSPDLLNSDDEDTAPTVPQTLRMLPSHFPPLPPKHTYMKTPVNLLQAHSTFSHLAHFIGRYPPQRKQHYPRSKRNSKLQAWCRSPFRIFWLRQRRIPTTKMPNFWATSSIGRQGYIRESGGRFANKARGHLSTWF